MPYAFHGAMNTDDDDADDDDDDDDDVVVVVYQLIKRTDFLNYFVGIPGIMDGLHIAATNKNKRNRHTLM